VPTVGNEPGSGARPVTVALEGAAGLKWVRCTRWLPARAMPCSTGMKGKVCAEVHASVHGPSTVHVQKEGGR